MPVEQQAKPEQAQLPEGFGKVGADLLQGHDNLAARRGISREHLEGLFNFSYERYLVGEYEAANPGFELLCLYDHSNPKYLQGYGYCLEALGHHHKAALFLYIGSLLMEKGSSDWATASLTAARLFIRTQERERGRQILQTLVDTLPETAEERTRALALIESLDNDDPDAA